MAEFCICFNRCVEVSEYSKILFLNRTDPKLLIPSISFSNSPNLDLDVITLKKVCHSVQSFREQMGSHFQSFRSFRTRKILICSNSHFLANKLARFWIPISRVWSVLVPKTVSFDKKYSHFQCFC